MFILMLMVKTGGKKNKFVANEHAVPVSASATPTSVAQLEASYQDFNQRTTSHVRL